MLEIVSLAIWALILGGLALIVRRFLRVTHRLERMEKRQARLRRRWWPRLPPDELERLLMVRRMI